MTYQRRHRGQQVTLYPTHIVKDARGNDTRVVDATRPIVTTAAVIPQRSSKAEVPGQQQIQVNRLIVTHDLPGIDLWSRVDYLGEQWDVVSPPSYHHGSRLVRHWSVDIRKRP